MSGDTGHTPGSGHTDERSADAEIKFGGWYNGDNWKPGRGWYYVCLACGEVGLGQILPQSAARAFQKHVCPVSGEVERREQERTEPLATVLVGRTI